MPLAAVTLYLYSSNRRALQVAAQHETEMLTGELTQRMQVVTTQISERVEHLMDMPVATTATAAGPSRTQTAAGESPAGTKAQPASGVIARATPATRSPAPPRPRWRHPRPRHP